MFSTPNDEALPAFQTLRDTPLSHSTYAKWFHNLDDALIVGNVWMTLFMNDKSGNPPSRPTVIADAKLYDEANTQTAMWIKIAAGWTHKSVVRPYFEIGDGIGMYKALRAQFEDMPTTRYIETEKLFDLWSEQRPIIGTDWMAECNDILQIRESLKENVSGLTIDDFIEEMALHTLIRRIPNGDPFRQRLLLGLDQKEHTFDSARDALVRHAFIATAQARRLCQFLSLAYLQLI